MNAFFQASGWSLYSDLFTGLATQAPGIFMFVLLLAISLWQLFKMSQGFKNIENEFKLVRSEMNQGFKNSENEFKLVRAEMKLGFEKADRKLETEISKVRAEMNDGFKDIRSEMKEGFLKVDHRLKNHDLEIKRAKRKLKH